MPLASYGQTSPKGLEPWQIESTLAPLAVGGSRAEAQNMLSHYQIERGTQEGQYEQDLAQQHQYAYDQLHQQLYEANLKGLAEAKDPTVLQLMAGNPTYSGVLGSNAANVGDALRRAQIAQGAKNYEAVGKGQEGFSNAGTTVDPNYVSSLVGAPVTPGENARITAERIRAAGAANAAAIRAAGAANTSIPETMQVANEFGGFDTISKPKGLTREQWVAQVQREHPRLHITDTPPANVPPPPVIAPPTTSGSSLQPAPAAQTAPAPNAPPANTAAGVSDMQELVLANQDKLPALVGPEGAKDIIAGMTKNNGRPIVRPDTTKKRGYAIVGASGQGY